MKKHKWVDDKCIKCKISRHKANKYIKDVDGKYYPKRMYQYYTDKHKDGTFIRPSCI